MATVTIYPLGVAGSKYTPGSDAYILNQAMVAAGDGDTILCKAVKEVGGAYCRWNFGGYIGPKALLEGATTAGNIEYHLLKFEAAAQIAVTVRHVVSGNNTTRTVGVNFVPPDVPNPTEAHITVNLATDGAGAVAATETAKSIAASINAVDNTINKWVKVDTFEDGSGLLQAVADTEFAVTSDITIPNSYFAEMNFPEMHAGPEWATRQIIFNKNLTIQGEEVEVAGVTMKTSFNGAVPHTGVAWEYGGHEQIWIWPVKASYGYLMTQTVNSAPGNAIECAYWDENENGPYPGPYSGVGALLYQAKALGAGSRDITIEHVVAGNNTSRSIAVVGNAITVNVATDGSGAVASSETVNSIAASVNAYPAASALVEALVRPDFIFGAWYDTVEAMAATPLSYGGVAEPDVVLDGIEFRNMPGLANINGPCGNVTIKNCKIYRQYPLGNFGIGLWCGNQIWSIDPAMKKYGSYQTTLIPSLVGAAPGFSGMNGEEPDPGNGIALDLPVGHLTIEACEFPAWNEFTNNLMPGDWADSSYDEVEIYVQNWMHNVTIKNNTITGRTVPISVSGCGYYYEDFSGNVERPNVTRLVTIEGNTINTPVCNDYVTNGRYSPEFGAAICLNNKHYPDVACIRNFPAIVTGNNITIAGKGGHGICVLEMHDTLVADNVITCLERSAAYTEWNGFPDSPIAIITGGRVNGTGPQSVDASYTSRMPNYGDYWNLLPRFLKEESGMFVRDNELLGTAYYAIVSGHTIRWAGGETSDVDDLISAAIFHKNDVAGFTKLSDYYYYLLQGTRNCILKAEPQNTIEFTYDEGINNKPVGISKYTKKPFRPHPAKVKSSGDKLVSKETLDKFKKIS